MNYLKNSILFAVVLGFLSCNESNPTDSIKGETIEWMGKTYHSIKIGNQVWMRENLDAGKMIPSNKEQTNNGIIEKYYYQDDSIHFAYLGGYYQWNEAMQYTTTPGARGICPPGWHIPTSNEWQILIDFLKSSADDPLKVRNGSEELWIGGNKTGFSAYLGGYRYNDGVYYFFDEKSFFWTSTEQLERVAKNANLWIRWDVISVNNNNEEYGFNIRCIKD